MRSILHSPQVLSYQLAKLVSFAHWNFYSLHNAIAGPREHRCRFGGGTPTKHRHTPQRDAVMISHAIEDNTFTRWLSLQLARNGYRVWCDLTKLLGGEIFWRDIEKALRLRAAKFVYILSRTSNSGEGRGFWKELDLADSEARRNGIHDFIVPVAIDDLQPGCVRI